MYTVIVPDRRTGLPDTVKVYKTLSNALVCALRHYQKGKQPEVWAGSKMLPWRSLAIQEANGRLV